MQFMLRLTLLYIILYFVANRYATGRVAKYPVCSRKYGWIQESSKNVPKLPKNWMKLKKSLSLGGKGVGVGCSPILDPPTTK